MRNINLALLFIFIFSLITPALALTGNETVISFNNLQAITDSDLEIHGLNATSGNYELLAIYNTSSPGVIFQPGTYTILVRTHPISRLTNPVTMFEDGMAFVETYWLQIFLILGIGVYVLRQANK